MATKARSIRVDDELWERTLKIAAKRGTTVTSLVNDYLQGLAEDGPAKEKSKKNPHFRVTPEAEKGTRVKKHHVTCSCGMCKKV